MIHATITEIGPEAVNEEEPMVILFNETATDALRKYSVIQEIDTKKAFSLQPGGTITFDEQEYQIEYVGATANQNLDTVGHVTLIFDQYPEEGRIVNGVYLSPYKLPELQVGTQISYY